jgi:hypothetical protein
MSLFYLTSLEVAKIILRERRMRLSRFEDLNDPFELLGASIGDRLARRVFKQMLFQHWSQTLGMICFSSTWQNPVMWAHYGDKHRGICLRFEVPDGLIKSVQYTPTRLLHLLDPKRPLLGLDQQKIEAVLLTKFKDWAYERERRVFARLNQRDPNGHFYVDFGPDLRLTGVIVGARCSWTVKAAADHVASEDRPVEVWKARASFTRFEIVRQKQVRAIKLRAGDKRPRR